MGKINRDIKINRELLQVLVDFKELVGHLGNSADISLRDGVFRELKKDDILTVNYDGWVIGHKIDDMGLYCTVSVMIKVPGYRFDDIPQEQKDSVMFTIFTAFFNHESMSAPEISEYGDSLIIKQDIPHVVISKET